MARIQLGDLVRDHVTGFTGVVIGISTFLHGCSRVSVQSRELKDHKPIDPGWFDEPQVELLERGVVPVDVKAAATGEQMVASAAGRTGGPMPSTPTRNIGG